MGTGSGNGEWESSGNLRGMTGESSGILFFGIN